MKNTDELVVRIIPALRRVLVECADKGITTVKQISPETLYECVRSSLLNDDAVASGFLPQNCFHVSIGADGSKQYCIWHPSLYADVSYFDTDYPHFPLPRLVFGFSVFVGGKIGECRLGVVKDEPPRESTPMYIYPFSNVAGFNLCTGNNELPVYKNRSTLATLPDYLLRLPNNNDRYFAKNSKLNMQYRDLLEHLKKKDPAYYYTDVLIESGNKLRDFIRNG